MPKTKAEDIPSLGHNQLSPEQLKNFVERIETLREDRKVVNADIKQIMDEADQLGYDKRTITEMIRIRAMDQEEREEREGLREMYLKALGLL